MKKAVLAVLALGAFQMSAQELPAPSPFSTLEQRVGLTDITIEYSRPGVKDREIFGELVPYDQLWRTGANMAPTIEFSTSVSFNGEEVEAGKYSLLTIPSEGEWTVILNSNAKLAGTNGYNEDRDVVRTEAEAEESDFTETFTIDINDIRNESASLVFRWEETKVSVPFEVSTHEQALANIERALSDDSEEEKWKVYRSAASYYYNNQIQPEKAMEYINKSIASHDQSWYSHWLKAEMLADQGMYEKAIESGKTAIKTGKAEAETSGNEFGAQGMVEAAIETWEGKKKES